MAAAETGTLWVCGAATKGLFVSCPIPKRVRSISAAGRKVAVTLDDGNVLAVELAEQEGKGPETDHTLGAVPWSRVAYHNTAHTCISSGSFGLLLSAEGEVFSWGDSNKWGELGLGGQFPKGTSDEKTSMTNIDVSKVSGSIFGKKIIKVAAGSTHAVAVSESGTLYSWGRGFEGQTGTTNLGVVLSPKLVKFSSEVPIAAVSCGHNFTICVTRQGGQLYAFGEGGCGQLGIGKCIKFSDKPLKCSALGMKRGGPRKGSNANGGGNSVPASSGGKHTSSGGGGGGGFPAFVDVSCGWAHAIARNERNEVYVWGLNAHGQLGLGHTDSIHLPMLLKDPYSEQETKPTDVGSGPTSAFNDTGTEYTLTSSTSEAARPPLLLKDISAYGLASAGVRADGRVLTWGSSKSGRLGHGASQQQQQAIFEPKLVDFIAGQKISMVHMSNDEMIAFAPTTLVKLEPTAGPIQGNSRFQIAGSGLWSSDKIVVRFEPISAEMLDRMYPKVEFEPFTRARSTIGKFHYDPSTGLQSISCRTPNMADTQKALKKYLASASIELDRKANNANNGVSSSKTNNNETVDAFSLLHPPHPQPMTISVSMNGIDFVSVGEQHHHHSHDGGSRNSVTEPAGGNGNRGGGSRMSRDRTNERAKRGPVTELRSHGIGPELKHRALYNFYSMAPFQLTSVHPRLLTLSSASSSLGSRNLDPPVYLYIGGIGLYETSSISVRLTAPGKKAIVCNTADVVFLRKEDGGAVISSSSSGGGGGGNDMDDAGGELGGIGASLDDGEGVDDVSGGGDIPATGLYVRLKVNDAIRELDESGRLPFETSSIAVALNGQDFVSLQGHRDENSVMFYRARLDSYTPSVVPAIAPPDSKEMDTSYGVPVTVKGSGFFRVANRASCNGNIWHLRLRLTDPLPKSKEDNNQSGDGDNVPRRRKKLGPDVLVPCRYEDVNTLTALLPPFPLRSTYLSTSNKRRKPKNGVEKWPKPWPSVTSFHVEVVMAIDDAKLLKQWETKLSNGMEAPQVLASTFLNNTNGEQVAFTTEEVALSAPDHLKVYSLPGMGLTQQGVPSVTLSVASGHFGSGKMIELVTMDPQYQLFSSSSHNSCLIRFAFTNKEGTRFIRDGGKKPNEKQSQLAVTQAQAALLQAQSVPEIEEDNIEEDDEEMLQEKALARQTRQEAIETCEAELEAAQLALETEIANAAADASAEPKSGGPDWFVDVPAIVEQINYSPETPRVVPERISTNKKGNNNNSIQKKRWVIRCKAPGLKKRIGGGTDFDVPSQSLEQVNQAIMNALAVGGGQQGGQNGGNKGGKNNTVRKKKKSKDSSSCDKRLSNLTNNASYGDHNPSAWIGMNKEVYAKVFVSLNGIHFHDWPANALTTGEPIGAYEDKNKGGGDGSDNAGDGSGAVSETPSQRVSSTTVYNYMYDPPVVTSIETPKGIRPGKELLFNGRNFGEIIQGVSKVKFTQLVLMTTNNNENELNNGVSGVSDDEGWDSDTGSSIASSIASAAKVRRKSLIKSYRDGSTAVVPCHFNKKQQIVCEVPSMGDEISPIRIELFLDGLRVMEIPSEDHFRSRANYALKATYTTVDLEYAGSSTAVEQEVVVPPPEPMVDPAEELSLNSEDDLNRDGDDGFVGDEQEGKDGIDPAEPPVEI